jgi:predicted Fe-S protein YdhL (DUF1289 family)
MEKHISFAQELKQKLKGTWDSPCIEVCSYRMGHPFCSACGLTRVEKKSWPGSTADQKGAICDAADQRIKTLVHS